MLENHVIHTVTHPKHASALKRHTDKLDHKSIKFIPVNLRLDGITIEDPNGGGGGIQASRRLSDLQE